MTSEKKTMKRLLSIAVVGAVVLFEALASQPAFAADPPADRTVVMYFHRTNPCPTCRKMSAYTEEAVQSGFAEQLKSGKVEYHYIDFQDENNAAAVKGYKIQRPTLILAKIVNNKVKEHKNLEEMWTKVGDKDAFVEYVQSNVKEYLK
jgi:thiol-disulfide isomerase/thioredoxin